MLELQLTQSEVYRLKIEIKKNLIVFRKPYEWYELASCLRSEYGLSIMLISAKCKQELGFTVRNHKGLVPNDPIDRSLIKDEEWKHRYHYEEQIHLDFYNEVQMSFFVLKYLNT